MKYVVIFLAIAGVLGVGGWLYWKRVKSAQDANNVTVQLDTIKRHTVERIVSANGKVASNRDVDIKCQASGTIKVLPYKDVSVEVKPGEMVCQLDPIDMQRLADTAQAVVDSDKSRIAEAELSRDIAIKSLETATSRAQTTLVSAQAQAADAHAKLERTRQLYETKPTALASKEELDTATTTVAQADAAVKNAQTTIAELEQQKMEIATRDQQIKQLQLSLAGDQSRLDTTRQNVKYCTVYAPEADNPQDPPRWFISSLLTNIAPGYIVQSGTSGFSAGTTIMTLSDLSHVYVLASVDESNIGQITDPARGGARQTVRVKADAFPGQNGRPEIFEGEVVRVATKGVNVSNVVTFEVKIEITSANKVKLRPEMTTTCDIVCASRVDVLAVPAADFQRGMGEKRGGGSGTASAPATNAVAVATDGAPTTGRGRGRGTGRGGLDAAGDGVGRTQQNGFVVLQTAGGQTENRQVVVGVLGSDPEDPASGDLYEVISGLEEGDTVVRQGGQESRFRNQSAGQAIQRLGGGGGRGR